MPARTHNDHHQRTTAKGLQPGGGHHRTVEKVDYKIAQRAGKNHYFHPIASTGNIGAVAKRSLPEKQNPHRYANGARCFVSFVQQLDLVVASDGDD